MKNIFTLLAVLLLAPLARAMEIENALYKVNSDAERQTFPSAISLRGGCSSRTVPLKSAAERLRLLR
jgi:hypothetical protein